MLDFPLKKRKKRKNMIWVLKLHDNDSVTKQVKK